MKINIFRYYIFGDSTSIKIKYYNTLEELLECSKDYIIDMENDEKNNYIGVGAEFLENEKVGAIDFILRRKNQEKFSWSNDAEKLDVEVPQDFRNTLEKLIEIL